jgi:hypothetical protein
MTRDFFAAPRLRDCLSVDLRRYSRLVCGDDV